MKLLGMQFKSLQITVIEEAVKPSQMFFKIFNKLGLLTGTRSSKSRSDNMLLLFNSLLKLSLPLLE